MKRFPPEILFLVLIGLILSSISFIKMPFANVMPAHLELAQNMLKGLKINRPFFPIGYSAFLFVALKCAGLKGIFACQATLYIATVIMSYLALRLLCVSRKIALGASFVILFHPYLILNIKRIITNNLIVPVLVAFVLVVVWIRRYGIGYCAAALFGLLFGCMLLIRPDFFILIAMVVFLLFSSKELYLSKKLAMAAVFTISALTIISAVTYLLTNRFFAIPAVYGAYNFFGGANPFTEKFLIHDYHIEFSIFKALDYLGVSLNNPNIESIFWNSAISYIKNHPFQYLYLCILKLGTLFRPDYRQIYTSITGILPEILIIIQTLLALPIFVWLFARLHCYHYGRNKKISIIIPFVSALCIIPFVFIGPEPRYRLPIDVILILDAAYCWDIVKTKERFASL